MLRPHENANPDDSLPEGSDDQSNRRAKWITAAFAGLILTPSMIGFVMKFSEFIHTFQDTSEGAFAITPMVNYLSASLGFLCLLIWAAKNGAFRDIERPKHIMLERELALDNATKSYPTETATHVE